MRADCHTVSAVQTVGIFTNFHPVINQFQTKSGTVSDTQAIPGAAFLIDMYHEKLTEKKVSMFEGQDDVAKPAVFGAYLSPLFSDRGQK